MEVIVKVEDGDPQQGSVINHAQWKFTLIPAKEGEKETTQKAPVK